MVDKIEVRDNVTLRKGGVHWIVENLYRTTAADTGGALYDAALLVSGLTGRRRAGVPVSRLKLHSKGQGNG